MEYSMDVAANKMVYVIVGLSFLVILGGFLFFHSSSNINGAMPFAIGVLMACGLNIAKIFLIKNAVNASLQKGAVAARHSLQISYFGRLVLTITVLLVAGLLHGTHVNLFGTAIGILTLPFATYSMRFFLREHLVDVVPVAGVSSGSGSSTQDIIDEIKTLSAGNNGE